MSALETIFTVAIENGWKVQADKGFLRADRRDGTVTVRFSSTGGIATAKRYKTPSAEKHGPVINAGIIGILRELREPK